MEIINPDPIHVSRSQIMREAREALSDNWGLAAVTMLVYFFFSAISGIIPGSTFIIAGPLAIGLSIWSLKIARYEDAQVSDIFEGFKRFGTALIAYLLMILAVLVGFMLFIIPGIIAMLGLGMTMFIIADDPNISAVDALKKSWAMMDGHKMDYFILFLRFIPWMILTALTLFIGLLWLIPWMQVSFAKFYLHISGNNNQDHSISSHFMEE